MFPGMNPRDMRMAMKKLGINQDEIDAKEVIIRLEDREIVISNPSVTKVDMKGQVSYQIAGEETERSLGSEPDISDEDIETVAEQAGVSKEQAEQAIKDSKGDLADAILKLKAD
jgi:nascent polypeptide-associated complex subunit alpha